MRKLLAGFVLMAGVGYAQEADAPVRIDHYTQHDLDRMKAAIDAVSAAKEAFDQVRRDINQEHGILVEDEKTCGPYDSVTQTGKTTLIITRVTPHLNSKGWCVSRDVDASGEGMETVRNYVGTAGDKP